MSVYLNISDRGNYRFPIERIASMEYFSGNCSCCDRDGKYTEIVVGGRHFEQYAQVGETDALCIGDGGDWQTDAGSSPSEYW